jgi:hypothetical protein
MKRRSFLSALAAFFSPALAAPEAATRYLFRLSGVKIPADASVVMRGLRQEITILGPGLVTFFPSVNQALPGKPPAGTPPAPSPEWSFLEGNVAWHIQYRHIGGSLLR